MYLKSSNGKERKQNSAINSAALQDHLLRKFNFNLEEKGMGHFGQNQSPY